MNDLIVKGRELKCPSCDGTEFTGCQYRAGEPHSYDGVSEWHCNGCGKRFGRWTHKELLPGDIERRYGREF